MTRHQQVQRYVNRNRVTDWLALDNDDEQWASAERDSVGTR